MASVIDDPAGRRRVQFVAPDGKRKGLRLGKVDRKTADALCRHVEVLLACRMTGQPVPRETASWLGAVSVAMRARLAAVGLVDAPKTLLLTDFLREHILSRKDVKPATLVVWAQPCRNLESFFPAGCTLRSVTAGNADQFKQWISTEPLAATTIGKRLKLIQSFFNCAKRHKFIEENPFAGLKIPVGDPKGRQAFVTRETIGRVLALAPPVWKAIIALSRYGGLRCPSEVLSIEWRHVDWEKGRVTVPSPKTERYAGKDQRTIPLFGSLLPFLREAFELAPPGATHIVGGGFLASAQGEDGWRNCNLRQQFGRLIHKAGLKPWPRMFHNLRASCETELLENFPVHVVAAWLGHDPKTLLKHYAQTTDDHFERAKSDAKSGALEAEMVQITAQQAAARNGTKGNEFAPTPAEVGVYAVPCDSLPEYTTLKSGGGGIRTLGRISPTPVFKTSAIVHSATPPAYSPF